MKRFVFSRKGFDSVNGGVPSPILADGRLVSLPIPEPSAWGDAGTPYDQIRAPDGRTLREVMADVGVRVPAGAVAHLDPDLAAGCRPRLPGWRPTFGTDDTSQSASHLATRLQPGDLILFYGWFAPAQGRRTQSRASIEAASVHAIFGYLEVEQLVRIPDRAACDALPEWMQEHPHVRDPDRKGNLLVLPREESTVVPGAPGAGAFQYLHDVLVLTEPGAGWYHWLLPHEFAPGGQLVPFTYRSNPKLWSVDASGVHINTGGIGQEYVVDCTTDVAGWARNVVRQGLTATAEDGAAALRRLLSSASRTQRSSSGRTEARVLTSAVTSRQSEFLCRRCFMTLPLTQQAAIEVCRDCAT